MTGRDALARAELMPLWQELHRRLSTGRPVDRLRVGPLGDTERSAVADLLGLDRLPSAQPTLRLRRLDDVVNEITGGDARALVESLLGPVGDCSADRMRDRTERDRLWRWLAEHPVVIERAALGAWVTGVRAAGLLGGSVAATRGQLAQALAVVAELPADGLPRPTFAARVLHDPHALDDGRPLAGMVLRAVSCLVGLEVAGGAEARRRLWDAVGVADDALSSTVLAAGLRPDGAGLVSALLKRCSDAGQAAVLSLAQLRTAESLNPGHGHVWVVENPSVLAEALRRFGAGCPPLVCVSGWPSSAALRLLRLLTAAGATVHYHGDFDGDGLRIAGFLVSGLGLLPWQLTEADYLRVLSGRTEGRPVGRVPDTPWDPALADSLRRHQIAVFEESAVEDLLGDLAQLPEL